MVTPREQKEMVLKYEDKSAFTEAFFAKYSGAMPFAKMAGRTKSLWQCRDKHAAEIKALQDNELMEKIKTDAQEAVKNHTIMIPARVVSKHTPSRDAIPDVGEILIRTNHLLAELVQLQKEQIALFREIQGGKK